MIIGKTLFLLTYYFLLLFDLSFRKLSKTIPAAASTALPNTLIIFLLVSLYPLLLLIINNFRMLIHF